MIHRLALAALVTITLTANARAGNWALERVNHVTLPEPASGNVREMSGVTYVGPAGAAHRFIANQQDHGNVVRFDVTFTAAGGIGSIANVVNIHVDDDLDFEGIAFTNLERNSVFMSDEDTPGVFEVSLATGDRLQRVTAIPSVYFNHRDNLSLESLTRSPDGSTMWTANEQALTVDGPTATAAAGSDVRLLKLNVAGNAVTAGPQHVYRVEPIHGSGANSRSGLCDLVAMPDGTLLALERSAAVTFPAFLNRIFEVNLAAASDVSVGPASVGMTGVLFTRVGKALLWSGTVNAMQGQNFEGLALGPRLPGGKWALIGVVDASSDAENTIVAFTATANTTADFDHDGDVDGTDFVLWQRGLGKSIGARLADGDGDRDGDVDAADLELWKAASAAPGMAPATESVPEPSGASIVVPGLLGFKKRRRQRGRAG